MQGPSTIIKKIIIGVDKRKIVGFFIAFFILLISYVLLYFTTREMQAQAQRVEHTNKVIISVETVLTVMREMGSNYRGYLITGEEKFKEDYFIGKHYVDSMTGAIKELTKDNSTQQSTIDSVRELLAERLPVAINNMELFKVKPFLKDSLLKLGYTGKDVGQIAKMVKRMEYHESSLLQDRKKDVEDFSKTIQIINITSLVIAILLAVYSLITYLAENNQRQKSENKAQQYRKELENRVQELSKANKELTELRSIEKFASTGRIARTMAHEIRNPLTNIHLATEQLRDAVTEGEENEMLLEMINRNSNRINQLISDLLNATKFAELHFKETAIGDLLDKALDLAKDRIELSQTSVNKNYDSQADALVVKVDSDKLPIAFLNIIVNSIEAMEPGKGILDISVTTMEGYCKISFTDNGNGMNDETVSRLFEPFFTSKQKGNGLGLTNTQNIVLNHKGTIEVDSMPGKGTTFSIILQLIS